MEYFNISKREYAQLNTSLIEFQDNIALFNVLQHRYPFKLYLGTMVCCYSHVISTTTGVVNAIDSMLFKHSQNNHIGYRAVIKTVDELVEHFGESNIEGLYLFSWGVKNIRYYKF